MTSHKYTQQTETPDSEPMYDRIMDLPLFKGSSRRQVSDLVEKVQLQFEKYPVGRVIASQGEECKSLILMLGGSANLIWNTTSGDFLLSQEVGKGAMIGSDNLFGMYCRYPFRIEATADCSLMRISKRSFMEAVMSDEIYFINLLNHLSLKIQRGRKAILDSKPASLLHLIKSLILTLTSGNDGPITVTADPDVLASKCGLMPDEIAFQANILRRRRLISRLKGRYGIISRGAILDATE